jgi:hypothetical protein
MSRNQSSLCYLEVYPPDNKDRKNESGRTEKN